MTGWDFLNAIECICWILFEGKLKSYYWDKKKYCQGSSIEKIKEILISNYFMIIKSNKVCRKIQIIYIISKTCLKRAYLQN